MTPLEIQPPVRERKSQTLIPRILRNKILQWNIPWDEAGAQFGMHEMRTTREVMIRGQKVPADTAVLIPGNEGVLLCEMGAAEFSDTKLAEEYKAMQEIQRLGLNEPARAKDHEAFQQGRKKSWVAVPQKQSPVGLNQ